MKKELLKAAVSYGILRAWIITFIVSVFGLIGFIYCIYLYLDSTDYIKTKGVIIEPNCEEHTDKIIKREKDKSETEIITTSFDCDLELEYKVNNKLLRSNLFKQNLDKKYKKNEVLDFGYKQNNPKSISDSYNALKWGAFFGITIIILVISITYFNLYIVLNNRSVAGVEGTIGFASNLRRALSSRRNNNY